MLTQPDDKLLLVGSGYNGKTEGESIGAMRLLPSGAVNPGYGRGGCASVALPEPSEQQGPEPVGTLDGGDLVLAPFAARYVHEPSFLAARFDAAGKLDPGFGSGGVVHDELVEGLPVGIAAGADGRITVVDGDEELGRLLPSGVPDPSFGKEGTVAFEHPLGIAVSMALPKPTVRS